MAAGTRLRNVEETARTDDLTTAAAGWTADPARTRFSAAALAFIAGLELRDFDLLLGAKCCLFQFDFHVVTQIRSAALIFSAHSAAEERVENSTAKSASAEHFTENFERIMENTAAETATWGERGVAESINSAVTRAATSSRWSASSNRAARRRKKCWTNSTASGAVPWSPSIRNTRFNLTGCLTFGPFIHRTG